jgi:hypothetical protein
MKNRSPGSLLRLSDAAPGIRHGAPHRKTTAEADLNAELSAVQL